MRFWTALQEPFNQAALVDNGKIIKRIPDHPPKTPARLVHIVGEYGDDLILGRRSDCQIWSRDGEELIRQIYHKNVYAIHWIGEYDNNILIGSGGLDVVFAMDQDGNTVWEWWAREAGYTKNDFTKELANAEEWLHWQLARKIPEVDLCGLNSIRVEPDGAVLVTLMLRNKAIRFWPKEPDRPFEEACHTALDAPHDFQFDYRADGRVVGGVKTGLLLGDRVVGPYSFVKRVKQVGADKYFFTHEEGAVLCDLDGKVIEQYKLPRPFGVFHLEL